MIKSIRHSKASIDLKEDTLTSSVIGTLQYLPSVLFWEIFSKSIFSKIDLPNVSGEIKDIVFWPRWSAEDPRITNKDSVEPDVFIRFESFDLIIEAKRYDGQETQNERQWKNQLYAYQENILDGDLKKLIYIALGGNTDLKTAKVTIDSSNSISIYRCSWFSLLRTITEISNELNFLNYNDPYRKGTLRILDEAYN